MAITDKEQGVWTLDQVYNKINQGDIWTYSTNVTGLYVWGKNTQAGALGLNDIVSRSSPTQIPGTTWSKPMRAGGHEKNSTGSCVRTDGTLWMWGPNGEGRLGLNQASTLKISSPTQVGTDTTWLEGEGGAESTSYLKTDGTLWMWGYGQTGEMGQNDDDDYSSPVQVPGTTWRSCSGGQYGYSATKTDGTLWYWGGDGYYGGRGNNTGGSNPYLSSPTQLPGSDWGITRCFNGGKYCVKTDGTLWAWGVNYGGQCGGNDTSPGHSSPIQIGTETTWGVSVEKLGSGRDQGSAIKTDGTLWMWGYNSRGELGQNSNVNRSSPTQVGTETTWRSVNINNYTTFATKTDNTAWSWGDNTSGAMGNNNTAQYSSPVQIPGTWQSPIGFAGDSYYGGQLIRLQ